jgi:hypothetical protein
MRAQVNKEEFFGFFFLAKLKNETKRSVFSRSQANVCDSLQVGVTNISVRLFSFDGKTPQNFSGPESRSPMPMNFSKIARVMLSARLNLAMAK